MSRWTVGFTKGAQKQIKRLPYGVKEFAYRAVQDLREEGAYPKGWDVKKTGKDEYRLRLNYRYRMRYCVTRKRIAIEVFYAGHRKEAYR